jgi:hypothetical protein
MPWVGFEPSIPAFERTKTVHDLDRAAIVFESRFNLRKGTMQYYHIFRWLWRGFQLVNVFIRSLLVVTAISSYTLQITVTTAHVTSHTKSSNSSSGHTAAPLELRNSSEVNSYSHILSYPLGTDHAQKTHPLYCCMVRRYLFCRCLAMHVTVLHCLNFILVI